MDYDLNNYCYSLNIADNKVYKLYFKKGDNWKIDFPVYWELAEEEDN